ncbi:MULTISPECIES: BT_3987 domain-containing protein [Chitinophagaceae]
MKKIIYFLVVAAILVIACNKQVRLQDIEASSLGGNDSLQLVDKQHPTQTETIIETSGIYTFTLSTKSPASQTDTLSPDLSGWDALVKSYNTYMQAQEYQVLPTANFSIDPVQLGKGATAVDITVNIKDLDNLDQGNYVLPLRYTYDGQSVIHIIRIQKDAPYTALSAANPKPMPAGTYNCPNRTDPMKMVAYVQTNDWDIRNYGQFLLKNSQKPVFDYVVMFAANMNYDIVKKQRYLAFNDKLQPYVRDPQRFIKPLKDRGIKVVLTILPNHQGVGYFNFQSYEDAVSFAQDCKNWADKLGIDGFDIDEEYADYSVRPELPTKGTQSSFWFLRAMKTVMPDKILTLYDYGFNLSSSSRDDQGKAAVDYIDVSWSDYNVTGGSSIGMPGNRYGNRSIEANNYASYFNLTYSGTALTNAANGNLNSCYGLQMVFNLRGDLMQNGVGTPPLNVQNSGAVRGLSFITRQFYGEDVIFSGKYY